MADKPTPTTESPQPAKANTTGYFFPNDGGVSAFSCQAKSLEEAEQLNHEHIKHLKEDN